VLAAVYVLVMYRRTFTGPTVAGAETMRDLGLREVVAVAPLMIALAFLGFYPKPVLDVINPLTGSVLSQIGHTDTPAVVPTAADGKASP